MRYCWYSIYAPRFALRLTELFKRRWLVHSKSFESQGVNMVQNARSSQTMANSTQGYYGKNIFRTLKTKLRLAWEGWVSPVFLDPRIAQWRTSALDLLRLSSLIECSNQDLLHMEPITESPMRPILHVRIILKLWIFLEGASGGLWKIVVQLPVAFLGSCNRTHENWKRWN